MVATTADLSGFLPDQVLDGMLENAKTGSTIAALSTADPMKFGNVAVVDFDEDPTGNFVEEGGAKGSVDIAPNRATAAPHKVEVTYRTTDEYLWADEDYQLGILNKFASKASLALSRALDLGAYYRLNPRTGSAITAWTNYLNSTTNRIELTDAPDVDIETAAGKLIGSGISPTGIAFSPKFAWTLATARYADGHKKFPELGLGTDVSNFMGLRASTSTTVHGAPRDADAADNDVRTIIGDYAQGIRWGIQKQIPFTVIPYGDPDNSGRDLKGHNEVALRAEIVYAWYVYVDRFAVLEVGA